MKKINDSRIYFYFALVTIIVALLLGGVSFYSILVTEPEVEKLLSSTENVSKNFKKAYVIVRVPHIFGGYENFDAEGVSVKNSITYFDRLIYSGSELEQSHKKYIELILDRRKKASRLGRYSMVFFMLLSAAGWAFFISEKIQAKKV
jgi:hypothetical protein